MYYLIDNEEEGIESFETLEDVLALIKKECENRPKFYWDNYIVDNKLNSERYTLIKGFIVDTGNITFKKSISVDFSIN